ncbi:hypothetical protein V5799_023260 [Amblyomma americanum]|uniref:Uncharacterized protein n=1 Tax=Amblyomma americanum TaxID=6943 RepID=A0AAQ4FJW6_AMBAM
MELLWMKGPRDGATLVLITFLGLAAGAHRRPVYIIAHMVNSIDDFDEAMRRGANAIEADVTFSHDGTAVKLFHGWPCDCLRKCEAEERVHAFLNYVRRSTNSYSGKYRHKLTLLFLDLKLGDVHENRKYAAGVDIAQKLLQHLWHGGSLLRRRSQESSSATISSYNAYWNGDKMPSQPNARNSPSFTPKG